MKFLGLEILPYRVKHPGDYAIAYLNRREVRIEVFGFGVLVDW